MTRMNAAVLTAALLAAAGCSNEPPVVAQSGSASAPVADPRAVNRLLPVFDYEPTSGPNELRDQVDLVVDAKITNVAEGRRVGAEGARQARHVVLTLMPTTIYKSPSGAGGPFYLELRRPNIPTATFREGIPDGTRLLFFGAIRSEIDEPVRDEFAGREVGEPLYGVVPEGFYIAVSNPADPARPMAYWSPGWGDTDTFDEITAALG